MSSGILVIAAHASDFVWRCAGTLAVATAEGERCHVVALSYGERGESGELWRQPGQTVENVKKIRHEEAARAAEAVGAELIPFDLGDYPLRVGEEAIERLAELIRNLEPRVMLTHTERDPFNPDHGVAHAAAVLARQLSAGAGVASAFKTITTPEFLAFEPHQPELCGFVPTTFVDVSRVWEKKLRAMESMRSQVYLQQYYAQRGEHRANHARRVGAGSGVKYAEAFQRLLPHTVSKL